MPRGAPLLLIGALLLAACRSDSQRAPSRTPATDRAAVDTTAGPDAEAEAEIPVYAQERNTGTLAFIIEEGETFTTTSGNVHVDTAGVVAVRRTVEQPELTLEPGDTLYLLDYLGEGFFHAWHEGEVRQAEGFWVEEEYWEAEASRSGGVLLRWPNAEWWVQARSPRGTGWVRMTNDVQVDGADACA